MAATFTRQPLVSKYGKELTKLTVAWTSDASGNASVILDKIYGYIKKVITVPDATAVPTDLYDITLIDENLVDALDGKLADRSATLKQQVYPTPTNSAIPVLVCGDHTFTIANAGNAKSGTCILILDECL